MTMITPSYLGETIEYSSLHACRSTLEDPTVDADSACGCYDRSQPRCQRFQEHKRDSFRRGLCQLGQQRRELVIPLKKYLGFHLRDHFTNCRLDRVVVEPTTRRTVLTWRETLLKNPFVLHDLK